MSKNKLGKTIEHVSVDLMMQSYSFKTGFALLPVHVAGIDWIEAERLFISDYAYNSIDAFYAYVSRCINSL